MILHSITLNENGRMIDLNKKMDILIIKNGGERGAE